MNRFISKTAATLGLATMSAVFMPQAQALDWVISPDANALAFGVTVVDGSAQLGSKDTSQPMGIFGAGFTVNSSDGVTVKFDSDLYTWDSYNAPGVAGTGYWDAFIVTISTAGYYWDLPKQDPVLSNPSTFVWGGQNFADNKLESYITAPGKTDQVTLYDNDNTKYYVSLVLDTKTLPNADTAHPSWGSFHVSVVPEPETYAMMLVGLGLLGFTARSRKSNTFA